MDNAIPFVLEQYALDARRYTWARMGKGHIHVTYKLSGPQSYVLQQFNDKVFTKPEVVEQNIRMTARFLEGSSPEYLFVSPISSKAGRDVVYDEQRRPWRLSPFVANSYSIDEASTETQAFRAASAFGRFGRLMENCNADPFKPTIDRFHDLSLRYDQFTEALNSASRDRLDRSAIAIEQAKTHSTLVRKYNDLISKGILRRRVFHNDTKINNVLFDETTHEAIAIVDLDTLMPGYFIYDLGDLVRTIASPVSEEEKDLTKVVFRREFYEAVVNGYLSEMRSTLSEEENRQISFSGQMMTYIMALRFLADFLRGDTYYHTTYPGQNLVRALNQLRLLELLITNT